MAEIPVVAFGVKRLRKTRVSARGVERWAKLGSNLGPDSAENPLKPHYRTAEPV